MAYDSWKYEGSNEDIYSSVPNGRGSQPPLIREKKKPVVTLIDVLSEVQKWRVAESKGIPLDPDRIPYREKIKYMSVGMKHGAIELFFTLFMFPVVAIFLPLYINYFKGHTVVGLGFQTLLVGVSLLPLAGYLILCLVLASMWSGSMTGGIIMSLLLGRVSIILMVGLFGSMLFYLFYELSGFLFIGHYFVSVFYFPHVFPNLPKLRAYYSLFFYKMIRPAMLAISIKLAFIFFLSGLIPIFTVGCKAWFVKQQKNKKEKGGK